MTAPLRLVLDTNVVLSALLWEGRPAELIDLAPTPFVRFFSCEELIEELRQSLEKPKLASRVGATGLSPAIHAANYRNIVEAVWPEPLPQSVSRDADDDMVLACALAANADAVVSGDKDLLDLGAWQGMAMLTPSQCLEVAAAWQQQWLHR